MPIKKLFIQTEKIITYKIELEIGPDISQSEADRLKDLNNQEFSEISQNEKEFLGKYSAGSTKFSSEVQDVVIWEASN